MGICFFHIIYSMIFVTRVQKELSVKMLQAYMSRLFEYFLNVNSSIVSYGRGSDTVNVYNILSYLFTIAAEILSMILIGCFIIVTEPWTALGVLLMGVVMLGMVMIFKPMAKTKKAEQQMR